MSHKVIITGPVCGNFEIFDKLARLHNKNAFSFAIILGDLFAGPETSNQDAAALLNGEIKVSFPTYFMLGEHRLPPDVQSRLDQNEGELCHNLYFLGKTSVTNTSESLRLVAVGGNLAPQAPLQLSKDRYSPQRTDSDTKSLFGAHNAHILITNSWPSGIRTFSKVKLPPDVSEPAGEAAIARLCSTLKPNYHFSTSSDLFWEREPFAHNSQDNSQDPPRSTRFISLAQYGIKSKQKFLYAFSIDPSPTQDNGLPSGFTPSPFPAGGWPSVRKARDDDESQPYASHSNHRHRGTKRQKTRKQPSGPESCYFCLSNPNIATHLITSIGDDSYLTTAKGPLTTKQTFPSINFPGHMLIIPLSHSASLANVNPSDARINTFEEMQRYRRALEQLVTSTSRGNLGSVTWEIARAEGVHFHWQLIPVPSDLIEKGLVDAAFKVEAENEKYGTFVSCSAGELPKLEGDYLRIWISRSTKSQNGSTKVLEHRETKEGGDESSMILEIPVDSHFGLQYPRKVMAKLLSLEERVHWKDCSQTEAEEKDDAEAFRAAFKSFDLT